NWTREAESGEQLRRHYEAAASNWARLGRGDGGRLDSAELAEIERWKSAGGVEAAVTPLLEELIVYSRKRIQQEQDAALEKEKRRTQSRERWLRIGAAVLAVTMTLLVGAIVLYMRLQKEQGLLLVQRLLDLSRASTVANHEFDQRAALY